MSLAENTNPHPLAIEDAREAQRAASETQRDHTNQIANAHVELANAEKAYREALADRLIDLREQGWPATVCKDLARGDSRIAELCRLRNVKQGALDALVEDGFRLKADRRALDGLVAWSKDRDLRTDSPPSKREWDRDTGEVHPIGAAA